MIARPSRPLAACAAIVLLAAPAIAGRPPRIPAQAHLPVVDTVAVHRGAGTEATDVDARYAEADGGGAGYAGGDYWESNYGREDDAAIFAARYGCVRPIWNAKSNRYMAACN